MPDSFALTSLLDQVGLSKTMGPPGLERVRRGLMAFRRGERVLIADAGGSYWTVPLDGGQRDELVFLSAAGSLHLALARRRAAALGLAHDGAGVVTVAVPAGFPPETLDAALDPVGDFDGIPFDPAIPATGAETAGVTLAKLARLLPVVAMAPAPVDADDPLSAADIALYALHAGRAIRAVADTVVPLEGVGLARLIAFRPSDGGPEHCAVVVGDPPGDRPTLVRVHSECFTGDVLGSLKCDCGQQLRGALAALTTEGAGILIYLAQEGRGIGLVNKLRAYRLQDGGFDTMDANKVLGFEDDERSFLPAAEMLRHLGVTTVRLMTNNPDKIRQLTQWGIHVVERVPHAFPDNGHNRLYLRTKARRAGHLF